MSDSVKHSLINGLVLVGIMWAFAYCTARTDGRAPILSVGCPELKQESSE